MTEHSVGLHAGGPPETALPPLDPAAAAAIDAAEALPADQRRAAVTDVAARWPRCCEAWAMLGDLGRDPIERYAAYRVGYHRGLDALRQNGWRGTGYVRWKHDSNRGFLRSLDGLRLMADEIGEDDEAERCAQFLLQLDPEWQPIDH